METDNKTREEPISYHSSLRSGATLLSRRMFPTCRTFIQRQPRSDPEIATQLDRMLAIIDVMEAASLRVGPNNNLPDHYAILQLKPSDDTTNRDFMRQRYKILVRKLDPNKNKFPLAEEALMRVRESWQILSDPVQLDRYEKEIKEVASFWTMCPYCWYLHEYEKKYEDCTLRCGNCRRTFHGTPVKPPEAESMVEGKEQYYCYHMSLPLRYPVDENCRFEIGGSGGKKMRIKTVANRSKVKGFVVPDSESESDPEMEVEL
ncbi:uncharacterized protein LOC131649373 [Vicia villosa]|uniref:uncharacterized protein LOC131649373 n=1 Tax=Vicia villosa TaxID=3911 RepID=UPI00273B5386|nr:uncharacterized protein LOC131649373 [Vicia villosa]